MSFMSSHSAGQFAVMTDDAPLGVAVRTAASSDALARQGFSETAELVARLTDRLMRQEQLIREERQRSAALELRLAVALAGQQD